MPPRPRKPITNSERPGMNVVSPRKMTGSNFRHFPKLVQQMQPGNVARRGTEGSPAPAPPGATMRPVGGTEVPRGDYYPGQNPPVPVRPEGGTEVPRGDYFPGQQGTEVPRGDHFPGQDQEPTPGHGGGDEREHPASDIGPDRFEQRFEDRVDPRYQAHRQKWEQINADFVRRWQEAKAQNNTVLMQQLQDERKALAAQAMAELEGLNRAGGTSVPPGTPRGTNPGTWTPDSMPPERPPPVRGT